MNVPASFWLYSLSAVIIMYVNPGCLRCCTCAMAWIAEYDDVIHAQCIVHMSP